MQILAHRSLIDERDGPGWQRLLYLALANVPELFRVVLPVRHDRTRKE